MSRFLSTLPWLALILLSACHHAPTTPADPGLVVLAADLGNDYVVAQEPSEVVARLRVQTRAIPSRQRPALDLAVVIDTSGSMRGQPIADAKAATLSMLDLLADGDRLSLVAFHSEAELLLPSTELSPSTRTEAREAVEALEARGTTAMTEGLSMGLQQVLGNRGEDTINRVVLLGDGVPNDASAIPNLARSAGSQGVAISALGLGLDYDEDLMGQVAQLSGGHFHYLEESSAVAGVFRDEVLRLERVIGRNASLTLQPGPGVTISSIVGQQMSGERTAFAVSLGDISEGEARELIVRLRVPAKREGAPVELLDARLSFIDAVDGAGALSRDAFLGADATADQEQLASGAHAEVLEAAERATAAEVTIQAIRDVRQGHLALARRRLAETRARMSKSGGAGGRYAASVAAFEDELAAAPGADRDEEDDDGEARPAAAPSPAFERSLREVHEESLEVLGY